jgi:hypothetical protein
MNKILVIHPKDPETDFLIPIYENIEDKFVIREQVDDDLTIVDKELSKPYETVIILGHGSPLGLHDMINNTLVVHFAHARLLKNKNVIGIWCNADKFFEKYGIKGFCTGMFISELREAKYYGITTTAEEIQRSSTAFVNELKKVVTSTPDKIKSAINENYVDVNNPIIIANRRFMMID